MRCGKSCIIFKKDDFCALVGKLSAKKLQKSITERIIMPL